MAAANPILRQYDPSHIITQSERPTEFPFAISGNALLCAVSSGLLFSSSAGAATAVGGVVACCILLASSSAPLPSLLCCCASVLLRTASPALSVEVSVVSSLACKSPTGDRRRRPVVVAVRPRRALLSCSGSKSERPGFPRAWPPVASGRLRSPPVAPGRLRSPRSPPVASGRLRSPPVASSRLRSPPVDLARAARV